MNRYLYFTVEDFACDEDFVGWVLTPNDRSNRLWLNWEKANPHKAPILASARAIVLAIKVRDNSAELTDQDLASLRIEIAERTSVEKKSSQIDWTFMFRAAAIIFIFLSVGSVVFLYKKGHTPPSTNTAGLYIRLNNRSDQNRLVSMQDGSVVILKPHARLTYPKVFNHSIREVFLEGEAYFEIFKNPKSPFLIQSHGLTTRVLGTSFFISSFTADHFNIKVTTGKVFVYKIKNSTILDSVTLIPNQQAFLLKKGVLEKRLLSQPLTLSTGEAEKTFTFKKTPVEKAIKALSDAYQIKINFNAKKYKGRTITASLSKLPVNKKIKMISEAIGAKYDFNEGIISIK